MVRLTLAAVVLIVGAAAVPRPQSTDPPLGYSGGKGQPDCTVCHLGNEVNSFDGTLTVDGLPERFVPGDSYRLTITLEAEETTVAGFQLAVLAAAGDAAVGVGRLEAVDGRTLVRDSAGVQYAHHSPTGTGTTAPDQAKWSVEWTAPHDAETIVLAAAANSGNGDESPLGDLVYVRQYTVEPLLQNPPR